MGGEIIIMNIYRLFWNDGTFKDIQGNSIEEAFISSGYKIKDIKALVVWYILSIN